MQTKNTHTITRATFCVFALLAALSITILNNTSAYAADSPGPRNNVEQTTWDICAHDRNNNGFENALGIWNSAWFSPDPNNPWATEIVINANQISGNVPVFFFGSTLSCGSTSSFMTPGGVPLPSYLIIFPTGQWVNLGGGTQGMTDPALTVPTALNNRTFRIGNFPRAATVTNGNWSGYFSAIGGHSDAVNLNLTNLNTRGLLPPAGTSHTITIPVCFIGQAPEGHGTTWEIAPGCMNTELTITRRGVPLIGGSSGVRNYTRGTPTPVGTFALTNNTEALPGDHFVFRHTLSNGGGTADMPHLDRCVVQTFYVPPGETPPASTLGNISQINSSVPLSRIIHESPCPSISLNRGESMNFYTHGAIHAHHPQGTHICQRILHATPNPAGHPLFLDPPMGTILIGTTSRIPRCLRLGSANLHFAAASQLSLNNTDRNHEFNNTFNSSATRNTEPGRNYRVRFTITNNGIAPMHAPLPVGPPECHIRRTVLSGPSPISPANTLSGPDVVANCPTPINLAPGENIEFFHTGTMPNYPHATHVCYDLVSSTIHTPNPTFVGPNTVRTAVQCFRIHVPGPVVTAHPNMRFAAQVRVSRDGGSTWPEWPSTTANIATGDTERYSRVQSPVNPIASPFTARPHIIPVVHPGDRFQFLFSAVGTHSCPAPQCQWEGHTQRILHGNLNEESTTLHTWSLPAGWAANTPLLDNWTQTFTARPEDIGRTICAFSDIGDGRPNAAGRACVFVASDPWSVLPRSRVRRIQHRDDGDILGQFNIIGVQVLPGDSFTFQHDLISQGARMTAHEAHLMRFSRIIRTVFRGDAPTHILGHNVQADIAGNNPNAHNPLPFTPRTCNQITNVNLRGCLGVDPIETTIEVVALTNQPFSVSSRTFVAPNDPGLRICERIHSMRPIHWTSSPTQGIAAPNPQSNIVCVEIADPNSIPGGIGDTGRWWLQATSRVRGHTGPAGTVDVTVRPGHNFTFEHRVLNRDFHMDVPGNWIIRQSINGAPSTIVSSGQLMALAGNYVLGPAQGNRQYIATIEQDGDTICQYVWFSPTAAFSPIQNATSNEVCAHIQNPWAVIADSSVRRHSQDPFTSAPADIDVRPSDRATFRHTLTAKDYFNNVPAGRVTYQIFQTTQDLNADGSFGPTSPSAQIGGTFSTPLIVAGESIYHPIDLDIRASHSGQRICQYMRFTPISSEETSVSGRTTPVCIVVPHNYIAQPRVTLSNLTYPQSIIVEAGTTVDIHASVAVLERTSSRIPGETYATNTLPTYWALASFILPKGQTLPDPTTYSRLQEWNGSFDPCASNRFGANSVFNNCQLVATNLGGTARTFTPGTTGNTAHTHTHTVPEDAVSGDRLCFAAATWRAIDPNNNGPYAAGSRLNSPLSLDLSPNHVLYSRPACIIIGKRPKTSIIGAGILSQSQIIGGNLSLARGAELLHGSWVEYEAIAAPHEDQDSVMNFGSGVGFVHTLTGLPDPFPGLLLAGRPHHRNPEVTFQHSRLTIANERAPGTGSGIQNPGHIHHTTGNIAYLYRGTGIMRDDTVTTISLRDDNFVNSSSRHMAFRFTSNHVTLGGEPHPTGNTPTATIPKGRTVILSFDNTVTITENIIYEQASFTDIEDVPQLIIFANYIFIHEDVTRIDAWLVADNTITTCVQNTLGQDNIRAIRGYLSDSMCTRQLSINGPVQTNNLRLLRTYGTGRGDYSEIINLSAAVYLWSTAVNPRAIPVTTFTQEMPPRL